MNLDEQYFRVNHSKRGHVAFYTIEKLAYGDVVFAENIVMPDGSERRNGERLNCFTCGENLNVFELETV